MLCSALCTGWVKTEIADRETDELMARTDLPSCDAAYAHVSKGLPLGRRATPAEVASCIAFLSAPEAAAVTGAVLTVDGRSIMVDVPTLAFD